MNAASNEVREAQALRDDLLAALFPRGSTLPSEMLQTSVKMKLLALVAGIEGRLLHTDQSSTRSWDMLARAGILREPSLIQFALARISEEKLLRNMDATGISPLSQLPAQLLGHENQRIADMARKLLQALQLAAASDENQYLRLDCTVIQPLCWRITTALQESGAVDHAQLIPDTERLLLDLDGSENPSVLARKIVFFLGDEHRQTLIDPRTAGLHLFIASMEQDVGLDADRLLRLIGEGSAMPLLLLLKARGLSLEQLSGAVQSLKGRGVPPEWAAHFSALDSVEVRAEIANWTEYE